MPFGRRYVVHKRIPPLKSADAGLLALFCLIYFTASKLGIATAMPPEGIVILWPSNAFILAALVRTDWRRWWIILAATVVTEIAADVPAYPVIAAAGYGLVNFSEAALTAVFLSFAKQPLPLSGPAAFARYLAAGPIAAAGIAALGGALAYKLGSPDVSYVHYWRIFWLGDATGLLVVGTAILSWRSGSFFSDERKWRMALEGILLAAGMTAASIWAFAVDDDIPVVYLLFPFLLWSALRFGIRGAAIAVWGVSAIAIGTAIRGAGPFATLSNVDAVLNLQGVIAVVAISTYMLAFTRERTLRANAALRESMAKQQNAERELRRSNAALEALNQALDQKVSERTEMLSKSLELNKVLLKEVHHRVKNNLQIVSALLSAHRRNVTDPATHEKFTSIDRQIAAIVAVYDVLQDMESVETADFAQIAPVLCRYIEKGSGGLARITTDVSGPASVSATTAVALALAVNELATNSVKHARSRPVAVLLSCRRQERRVLIGISDDGPGFPADFDFSTATGFGMRMMRRLIEQAGGRVELVRSRNGATVEISVPALQS